MKKAAPDVSGLFHFSTEGTILDDTAYLAQMGLPVQ
jgi:hypothetical protein